MSIIATIIGSAVATSVSTTAATSVTAPTMDAKTKVMIGAGAGIGTLAIGGIIAGVVHHVRKGKKAPVATEHDEPVDLGKPVVSANPTPATPVDVDFEEVLEDETIVVEPEDGSDVVIIHAPVVEETEAPAEKSASETEEAEKEDETPAEPEAPAAPVPEVAPVEEQPAEEDDDDVPTAEELVASAVASATELANAQSFPVEDEPVPAPIPMAVPVAEHVEADVEKASENDVSVMSFNMFKQRFAIDEQFNSNQWHQFYDIFKNYCKTYRSATFAAVSDGLAKAIAYDWRIGRCFTMVYEDGIKADRDNLYRAADAVAELYLANDYDAFAVTCNRIKRNGKLIRLNSEIVKMDLLDNLQNVRCCLSATATDRIAKGKLQVMDAEDVLKMIQERIPALKIHENDLLDDMLYKFYVEMASKFRLDKDVFTAENPFPVEYIDKCNALIAAGYNGWVVRGENIYRYINDMSAKEVYEMITVMTEAKDDDEVRMICNAEGRIGERWETIIL